MTRPHADESPRPCRFAADAMGSSFEVLLPACEPAYARQAAMAALREVHALERQLSRFLASSDVARINRLVPGQTACIGEAAWQCLQLAAGVHALTAGAFDVTIGPLLDLWQDRVEGDEPPADVLREARRRVGMDLLSFDVPARAVGVVCEGVRVDLGGIGKGCALDGVAELLRNWQPGAALIHGGQSTVLAVGSPPHADTWTVSLRDPRDPEATLGTVSLCDRALSGSGRALHGRHILDPRTGRAATAWCGAWALADSAAVADALSTAFMAMSLEEVRRCCADHPVAGLLAADGQAGLELIPCGGWPGQPNTGKR